jgi:hypothetical protein
LLVAFGGALFGQDLAQPGMLDVHVLPFWVCACWCRPWVRQLLTGPMGGWAGGLNSNNHYNQSPCAFYLYESEFPKGLR